MTGDEGEDELRAWARASVTGIDPDNFSVDALRGLLKRRLRRDRKAASIDRLAARVVWSPRYAARFQRWGFLAIAGPRGALP